MNCEQARIQMLGETEGKDFAAHIASCEACRSEVSRIGALWQSLDLLPVEEPSGKVRDRFYEMLGAYRQGMASAEIRKGEPWWTKLGWTKLAWQMAAAAALLAVGTAVGYGVREDKTRPEMVQQTFD